VRRLIVAAALIPWISIAAVPDKECLPAPDNVVEESDVATTCEGNREKIQYEPTLLTPRIFEKRLCDDESDSGATYEKGEELYVTGKSPFTKTNEPIEEVEETLPEE